MGTGTKVSRARKDTAIGNKLYESIMDGITSGVWVADKNNVIYYANKAMEMIAGVTQQKLIGSKVFPSSAELATKEFRPYYDEAQETLRPVYYSGVSIRTSAGKQTYQSGWLIPKIKNRSYDGMICTVEDITNEKQARKALKESEVKYKQLVESANSIILRMDDKGVITFINPFAQKYFGYGEQEIVGKNIVGTIMRERESTRRDMGAMLQNIGTNSEQYASAEIETIRKNGETAWISWSNKALVDDSGTMTEVLCIGNDVTVQKQHEDLLEKWNSDLEERVKLGTARLRIANEELQQEIVERNWMEQSLRKSEEKYRLVVEFANEGILITQDNFFRYVNPKAEKILGHSKEELTSRPFTDFIYPDDREMVMERHLKRIKGDSVPNYYSCRIVDGEGNIKWLEINSVLITWMGRPATLAFFSNITERKKAEEKLRLIESAIQQAGDAVVITMANPGRSSSRIVYVNPAFTKMTGYSAEEVTGKLTLLQGPLTDSTQLKKLEAGTSQNKVFYLETVATRKDGTQFNMEWQITPLRDERGKVTHFVSVQRDITERKKTEEQFHAYQEQLRLLASELLLAEERERRRIAMDLHDNIGQMLALTRIKLGVLRNTLSGNAHEDAVGGIVELIDQSISYTKSLSFELSPPLLYDIGIEATIEWLAEQMQKQHYILFYCDNDGSPKPLKRDVSILLFQTVRELFMNIVKHSQAHQVNVVISRVADDIKIVIEDDGIGFDASKIDTDLTFGFFSIRERLKYLGGALSIDTGPGRGTRVTVTSPLDRKENTEGVRP
jgi:PAS domain S-box-containing protein